MIEVSNVFGRIEKVKNMKGRGRMGGDAKGLGGACRCPECNYVVSHQRAEPCDRLKCPKCGAMMIRV